MQKTSGSKSRQISEANPLEGFHAVKKFDADANLVALWGTKGEGEGQFLHTHGIAVDSSGNIYVGGG